MKKLRIACALFLVAQPAREGWADDGSSSGAEAASRAEVPAVRAGDRVRVRLRGGSTEVGQIESLSETSLRLILGSGEAKDSLDWSRIESIDRSSRRSSRWKRGAAIGALGNVLIWSVAGPLATAPPGPSRGEDALSTGDWVAFGFLTAPVGALLGGLIGHAVKKDVWEPVQFDRDKRVSLGVTIGGSPRQVMRGALTLTWN